MEKRSPVSGNSHPFTHRVCKWVHAPGICLAVLAVLSLAFTFQFPGEKKEEKSNIRKAAVAGGFYPGDKKTLGQYVDALLRQANPPEIKGQIVAIMVPHAGYVYSGPVAAYAYQAIKGRDIKTVVLMSNSHRNYLDGIAVYKKGSFETPLGSVPVDEEKTQKLLAASPRIMDRSDVHELDHVIEVQIPFLQRTLKDFKIVPLLFGTDDPALPKILANALKDIMDDKTLIVASTDMSHYPPYEDAKIADLATADAILTGKQENLDKILLALESKKIPQAETFLCGVSGVRTAMRVAEAEGATEIKLLKYANSGDTAGNKKNVVGYSAIAFIKPYEGPKKTFGVNSGEKNSELLNQAEQAELLKLARLTVESYVKDRKIPEASPSSEALKRHLGVFVTLKKHGQLRGCIGRFEPKVPLYIVVQQMAAAAATQDPRFPPVSPEELGKLEYEISVLSPLRRVASTDEIELGKHGVQLSKGFQSGVFLPQVAAEMGWNKETFLSELCSQKAGLPEDCWKDPSVNLQVFTAQIFPEEKK